MFHHADCVQFMAGQPAESVDMVITSPPYNVGIDYGTGREADKRDFARYGEFAQSVMGGVARLLRQGGRACVEIGGSGRMMPLNFVWQQAAYAHGLGLFSQIVLNHRKTNECAWGSWLKADALYTIPNFHELYVFFKGTDRRAGGTTTITPAEFIEWTKGRWTITWQPHKGHPASFPVELPERCMKLFGYLEDIVFDPFMGSGSTAIAAHKLGRQWLGCELNADYVALAQRRMVEWEHQPYLPLEGAPPVKRLKQLGLME